MTAHNSWHAHLNECQHCQAQRIGGRKYRCSEGEELYQQWLLDKYGPRELTDREILDEHSETILAILTALIDMDRDRFLPIMRDMLRKFGNEELAQMVEEERLNEQSS